MTEKFICFMAGLLIGMLLIMYGSSTYREPALRAMWLREAVAHNAGEYYLDANNERQWRWKETK